MAQEPRGWEIVDQVVHVLKIGGALSQEPYQGMLYALCRQAADGGHTEPGAHPRLTGDGLVEAIMARWPEADRHQVRLGDLATTWRAWLYALSHRKA